tara:strand:- start:264 stop:815 length:552 start_codon:yes stop_codon:yes gene_type:complete
MDMQPTISDERFLEVFNQLERLIEEKYAIPVRIKDVPSPFTGDLDGAEIHVDYAEDPEGALFILVHLFGHTVQWHLDPKSREIGMAVFNLEPTPENLEALKVYEVQACRYSMQLMHETGVHDLDQWLSDFAACDFAYLKAFYLTRTKKPFRSFWKPNQPLITPLEIPNFHPKALVSRWKGVVI